MRPRKIKRLRKLILHPSYNSLRWGWMWKESDLWYEEWLVTRNNGDMKNSVMYRKRAEWYSKKMR